MKQVPEGLRSEGNNDTAIALKSLFLNAEREVSRLYEVAEVLEEAIANSIVGEGHSPGLDGEVVQSIDFLRQNLNCFEILFHNLYRHSSSEDVIGVKVLGDGIYLQDLRDSLVQG